mgnify:CR=1 FL=1
MDATGHCQRCDVRWTCLEIWFVTPRGQDVSSDTYSHTAPFEAAPWCRHIDVRALRRAACTVRVPRATLRRSSRRDAPSPTPDGRHLRRGEATSSAVCHAPACARMTCLTCDVFRLVMPRLNQQCVHPGASSWSGCRCKHRKVVERASSMTNHMRQNPDVGKKRERKRTQLQTEKKGGLDAFARTPAQDDPQ